MPPGNTLVFGIAGGIVRELWYFGIVVGSRLPPGTGSAQATGPLENVSAEKTAKSNLGAQILSMDIPLARKYAENKSTMLFARSAALRPDVASRCPRL